MEVIYQMYRTCLYNNEDIRFFELGEEIIKLYDNEVLYKMKYFYKYKKSIKVNNNKIKKQFNIPTLLKGNSRETLKKVKNGEVNLVFTSPPYYNAREYSDYTSYKVYLQEMKKIFKECHRILEIGRFLIINVSPVIIKRVGREFESIRYPIHFDYHRILQNIGFNFIDEILWIKPEYSVPNRIGGYLQTRMPLSYKPNCITESILVYRKQAPFLLDQNIKHYDRVITNYKDEIDKTNCWYISPKSNKYHPAVFPEELCEKILKYYSFETDIVLDPFAGSGTFGKVAKHMNRIPLLCEINSDYIKLLEKDGYDVF